MLSFDAGRTAARCEPRGLADDFDAGRGGVDLLGERARLVLRAGEGRAQHARQRGLGVAGGDPDGIADPLGFGVEPSRLGMDLTEGDIGVPVAHRHPGLPHLRRSEISEPGNTGARLFEPPPSSSHLRTVSAPLTVSQPKGALRRWMVRRAKVRAEERSVQPVRSIPASRRTARAVRGSRIPAQHIKPALGCCLLRRPTAWSEMRQTDQGRHSRRAAPVEYGGLGHDGGVGGASPACTGETHTSSPLQTMNPLEPKVRAWSEPGGVASRVVGVPSHT